MSEPTPTRPDPGETQYGSRVPPPPPLQDNPRLIQYYDERDLPQPTLPGPGRYEDEYTWWGRRRRRRINAELERRNLAVDIAELEAELGIGEPCCDGICVHHVRMEETG